MAWGEKKKKETNKPKPPGFFFFFFPVYSLNNTGFCLIGMLDWWQKWSTT